MDRDLSGSLILNLTSKFYNHRSNAMIIKAETKTQPQLWKKGTIYFLQFSWFRDIGILYYFFFLPELTLKMLLFRNASIQWIDREDDPRKLTTQSQAFPDTSLPILSFSLNSFRRPFFFVGEQNLAIYKTDFKSHLLMD